VGFGFTISYPGFMDSFPHYSRIKLTHLFEVIIDS
jgi:hypothetical protein